MNYFFWLLGLGAIFTLLERWAPRQERRLLRKGWATDLTHILMNSFAFPYLIGQIVPYQFPSLHLGWAVGLGWAGQFVLMTLYCDLAQYGIHNLLHRVPFLWRFHKIHHQAPTLDWMVNWHFHYAEVLVYRSLLYVPAGMFGFSGEVMFWHGVLGTAMGLPVGLLRGAGLVLLPWGAFVAWCASRAEPPRPAVLAVVVLNLIWAVDSVVLLATGWVAPNGLGVGFVLVQAAMGGGIAVLQWLALPPARRLQQA